MVGREYNPNMTRLDDDAYHYVMDTCAEMGYKNSHGICPSDLEIELTKVHEKKTA